MKVMTYNIRGGWGIDGVRSTERIANVIRAHSPDIVLFQEVHQRMPKSLFVDQPGRLQRALGMPFIFQVNLRLGIGNYGLGIASPFPAQLVQNHLLPSVREQRGVLQVQLETDQRVITVYCTHWGLNGGERERQSAHLSELVSGTTGPMIIGGDFNEGPDGSAIKSLLARTGLSDADAEQNRCTYPADMPEARIDYLLYSADLTLKGLTPLVTPASDHLPLIAEFEW